MYKENETLIIPDETDLWLKLTKLTLFPPNLKMAKKRAKMPIQISSKLF